MRQPQPQPLLKRLWLQSQTKYLAVAQAVSGTLLYSASQLHDMVNSPGIKDALSQLTLPKWFPLVLLGLATLTYIAHGHQDNA